MKTLPRISETEWEIMRVVWAQAPVTTVQILETLNSGEEKWHPATTKTLINRLVRKGALIFEKENRGYLYSPGVTEKECIKAVSASFLDRVFGGSLTPMLAHFVGERKLTAKEAQELRALLRNRS